MTYTIEQIKKAMHKVRGIQDGCPLRPDIKNALMSSDETAELLVTMDASANTTMGWFIHKVIKELQK